MKYSSAAATMPPITWEMMYAGNSLAGNLPPTTKPTDTAGLRWQPLMCPMANAMVNTVSPNARATPNSPIPTAGNAAANTALPQPPNTSQNVPNPSVIERLNKDMQHVLDRSLYPISKSMMLPADLLQRPSGHCFD